MIRKRGPFGKKVLYFDGIDDYVKVPHNDTLMPKTAITIEVLAKSTNKNLNQWFVSKWNRLCPPNSYGYELEYYEGSIYFAIRNGNDYLLSYQYDIQDKILHIVGVYEKDRIWAIYINGKQVVTDTLDVDIGYTTVDLNIGRRTNSTLYFSGIIYLVRIWNRALSANEIKRIYHEAFLMKPTSVRNGLVLELIPDTVDWTNKVWRDNSGHNNDGTIYGCKLVYV